MTQNPTYQPTPGEASEWLSAIAAGDQNSFAKLLRAYQGKVYTQAITYLKSPESATEITQDIFLKIWHNREKLTSIESFDDYLFIMTRNEIISALRKKRPLTGVMREDPEELLLRPDRQLQFKESYSKLMALIDRLPPVRKKVFTMSRLEGKSYEEIGRELGISRNGVKDHIVNALNFLRTRFSEGDIVVMLLIATLFEKYFKK